MDIQFYGANCVTVSTRHARVTIDDNLADMGMKSVVKPGDVAIFTGAHENPVATPKLVLDQPGEYEVTGVSIYGIAARSHIDEEGLKTATIYKIVAEDISVLVLGHVYPELNDAQLEAIGMVDIVIVPVGGNGYTLDGIGALKLIKKIEPKITIPTHYDDPDIAFPVPQQTLEQAVKSLAMEPKEPVAKLRLKSSELGEASQLVILEKS